MKHSAGLIFALLLFLVPASSQADDLGSLDFNRPVVDNAAVLDGTTANQIGSLIRSIHAKGGPQIGIVTLKNLDGDSIESVSIQIAEKWKLGNASSDNGVIIVLANSERKMRIEVGNGIEGELPDAYAKQIIDAMTPYFKSNQFGQGLAQGVAMITQKVAPQIDLNSVARSQGMRRGSQQSESSKSISAFGLIIKIIIFLVLISTRFGRTLILMSLFSGRGGGGFGGSSGTSGGFSGGGGGFSGGGASGGW